MPEWWQTLLSPEHRDALMLGASTVGAMLGAMVAAAYVAFRGHQRGRPTAPSAIQSMAQVPAAVQGEALTAALTDFRACLQQIAADTSGLREDVEKLDRALAALRDLLVKIEDRTRTPRR